MQPANFTGREWVFTRLEAFLRGPSGVFLLVGAPGTGKTAIAAQLARTHTGSFAAAASAAPPDLRVDAAYFCRAGQVDLMEVAHQLSDQLADAMPGFEKARHTRLAPQIHIYRAHVRTGAVGQGASVRAVDIDLSALGPEQAFQSGITTPLSRLREAGNAARVVLLVDGLDEALAYPAAKGFPSLLATLAEHAHVVVTARNDIQATGSLQDRPETQVIDLVRDAPAESDDIYSYLQQRLAPYGGPQTMDRLAQRIARKANGNFLYAVHVVEGLVDSGMLPSLDTTTVDRIALPEGGLPKVYRDYLWRELWRDEHAWTDRFSPLFALLAVAQDEGLSTQHLMQAASHLHGRPMSLTMVRDSIRESKQLVDGLLPDGPFHLYHQSFADFLVDPQYNPHFLVDPDQAHKAIVAIYASTDPLTWDPYGQRNVATHAAQVGQLDTLLDQPLFLLIANPDRLLAVIDIAVMTRHGRPGTAVRLLRQVGSRLRGRSLGERAAVLELGARQLGANWIADALAPLQLERPWSLRWAHQKPISHDQIVGWHEGPVGTVAVGERDGRPVVISGGGDGMVRVWDLRTLGPLLAWPHGEGTVQAIAVGEFANGPVVVSGGEDGRLRRWSLADGTPIGAPITGHYSGINSVAVGNLAGRPVIVSGGQQDLSIRIWDLADGQLLHVLELDSESLLNQSSQRIHAVAIGSRYGQSVVVAGHDDGAYLWGWTGSRWTGKALFSGRSNTVWTVAFGVLNARPVAVCGDSSGRLTTWDLETGEHVTQPIQSPDHMIIGVAAGEIAGRTIAVTGNYFGRDPGILRVWDLGATTLRASLVGHYAGVKALAVTRIDGRPFLVSGGFDNVVRLWDLVAAIDEEQEHVERPHFNWLLACQLESRPVVVSRSLLSPEEPRDSFVAPPDDFVPDLDEILEMASRTPTIITTTTVWSQADGTPVETRMFDGGLLDNLHAAGQVGGRALGVTVGERTLSVWDLERGIRVGDQVPTGERFDPRANIAIGALGDRIVVAFCDRHGRLQGWDVGAGAAAWEPLPTSSPASCRAFGAPNGRPITVVAHVGRFRIWDPWKRELLAEPPTMQREARMDGPAAVGVLAGRPVVAYSTYGRPILIWDVRAARERFIQVDTQISAITIAPDSTILAGGSNGLLALRVEARFFDPDPSSKELR